MHREHRVRRGLLAVEALLKSMRCGAAKRPIRRHSTVRSLFPRYDAAAGVATVGADSAYARVAGCGRSASAKFRYRPYYEVALEADTRGRSALLTHLNALDALFVAAGR